MRGASLTYLYTQDEDLYSILEDSVRNLLSTQDADGRFSTYSIAREFQGWDIWCRKYILLGLQYFLEICRDKVLSVEILKAAEAPRGLHPSKDRPCGRRKAPDYENELRLGEG